VGVDRVDAAATTWIVRRYHSKEPNELFCCLIRARHLALQDRQKTRQAGQSDPFAVLTCAGRAQKSSVKKSTLNPRWVERLAWDADDLSDVLDVTISDACVMSGHAFLGRATISMEDLRRRVAMRRWFPLKDEDDYRDRDRGEVELLLHWHHNPLSKPRKFIEEGDDFDPHQEAKPNCLVVVPWTGWESPLCLDRIDVAATTWMVRGGLAH